MMHFRAIVLWVAAWLGAYPVVACDVVTQPNNNGRSQWYCASASPTVFVFVHGLNSNSADTWLHMGKGAASTYWPKLVMSDQLLAGSESAGQSPSVLLASFHTGAGSKNFSIADAQKQLFDALFSPIDGQPPAIEKSTIVLIGHSLGGVLVRDLLSRHPHRFQGKRVGLLLVASPSKGSSFANGARIAQWAVGGNTMVQQLERGSAYLDEVHRRFSAAISETGALRFLVGRELMEHYGVLESNARCASNTFSFKSLPCAIAQTAVGYVDRGPVVDVDSAAVYWPETKRLIPESDHFSIAKPTDPGHPTHQALRELVQATRTVAGCSPPDTFGVTFKIKQDEARCASPGVALSQARFELLQLSTDDGTPLRSALPLNFDPITRSYRLRLAETPFPCADDIFWGKLVETVGTSRLKASEACLTEVCFRRSGRAPAAKFATLDCVNGGQCLVPGSKSGLAESCNDQDRTPIMVAARQEPVTSSYWIGPSLGTLQEISPQARTGYTEFNIISEPLHRVTGVTSFGYAIKVNGTSVRLDDLPEFFKRTPIAAGSRIHLTLPIENLGFRGGRQGDGYEDIEVQIRFFRDEIPIGTATLKRRYVAYRHAPVVSETDAETGEMFSWRAIYRPAGSGQNFEVMLEHGADANWMRDRRASVDQLSKSYGGQAVIGVLRPGRAENSRIGMILGLEQETGQVRSLFTKQDAEGLCKWIRDQPEFSALQKETSYIFEFPLETFDEKQDRGRRLAYCKDV